MQSETTLSNKIGLGALALGAVVALAPTDADAATLRIQDLSAGGGSDFFVQDTGTLTDADRTGVTIGNMTVDLNALPSEGSNDSLLNATSQITAQGAGNIRIITSEDGFGAGAGAPEASRLAFSITSTQLGPNGVLARSYVDDGNGLEAQTDQIGSDLTLSGAVDTTNPGVAVTTDTAALSDPFSITSVFEIEHDTADQISSFDATATAAIPLPAGIWLMLGALGGLFGLRHCRKATAA